MPYPHPEPLSLRQTTADPYLHGRHSNTVLSQSLWNPLVVVCTRFVWALWVSLLVMGFYSKHEFAPPTIFLGLFLCPWTWGISSQLLQCLPSYWGFSDLGHGVSPQGWSSEVQPLLLTLDVGYLLSSTHRSSTAQLPLVVPALHSCWNHIKLSREISS